VLSNLTENSFVAGSPKMKPILIVKNFRIMQTKCGKKYNPRLPLQHMFMVYIHRYMGTPMHVHVVCTRSNSCQNLYVPVCVCHRGVLLFL